VIIDAGGGDIGVAEPLLDLRDVGLVVEGIGGGRRAQRVGANIEAEIGRVAAPVIERSSRWEQWSCLLAHRQP
jgi:hypothetical protein